MEKGNRPPEKEQEMGVRSVCREEQRPYLRAFRAFIRDPANTNGEGALWTPLVVLEALWDLWEERPEIPGAFRDFRDRHEKCIERLRSQSAKAGADDPVLYGLILRFLKDRGIEIPPLEMISTFRNLIRDLRSVLPVAGEMPAFDRGGPGIRLYIVETGLSTAPIDDSLFLALQLPEKLSPCCPAILFPPSRLDLVVGLYFFAARECYAQAQDTQIYCRFTVLTSRSRLELDRKLYGNVRKPTIYGSPYTTESTLESLQQFYCSCERSEDAAALEFSRSYLKNFNFDT